MVVNSVLEMYTHEYDNNIPEPDNQDFKYNDI